MGTVWRPKALAGMPQREVAPANAWPTLSMETDDMSINELTAVNARAGAYYDNALRNTFSMGAFR
jgi:hypothetical protein